MAKNWIQSMFGRRSKSVRASGRASSRDFKPQVERLEDIITPTITLGPVSLTPAGPINEGQSATLTGSYTATNIIGALQLTISASAPIQVMGNTNLQPGSGNFSIPILFLDNNTPPTTPVNVSVSLRDTGPSILAGPSAGYRAISVPFMSNISLNSSFNAFGAASGVSVALQGPAPSNSSAQVSLNGNSFRFYGANVTGNQINISENGLIALNGLLPANTNNNGSMTSLPNTIGAIAPLWTDLVMVTNSRILTKFVDVNGDVVPDYLLVEWSGVAHALPGGGVSTGVGTFQAYLQLNTGTADGDVIVNYVNTNFNDPPSNFGANATVGIKNTDTSSSRFINVAVNPGQGSSIIQNFSNGHSVRFSSNPINTPLQVAGASDSFGYQAFRMPFDVQLDLNAGTINGQTTNVILGAGGAVFSNTAGFQSGPQSFTSTIAVGGTPIMTANTFSFYNNTTISSASVSKNGYMVFNGTAPNNSQNSGSMGSAAAPLGPLAAIAALWDDWNNFTGATGTVLGRFIDWDGNGAPEYVVIDWKGVQNGGIPNTPANFATFQAMLQLNTGADPGQIYLNYSDTDVGNNAANNGARATVGIKNTSPAGGNFINVSQSTNNPSLASQRAIGIFQVGSATQGTSIQVNNVAPVLSSAPPLNQSVNEGATYTRTINIADPGVLDTFTGTVDWGDGTAIQNIPAAGVLPAGTTSFQISHVYGHPRPTNYTVTVNLTDKDGGVAVPFVFVITVNNVAPTLTVAANQLIRPGQNLVLDGLMGRPFLGNFTDPGFTVPSAMAPQTFTTTVNWGDGNIQVVPPNVATLTQTVVNGSPGVLTTGTIAATHLYTLRGLFTVTVTVTDDQGGMSTQTLLVSVGSTNLYVTAEGAGAGPFVRAFDTRFQQEYLAFNAYSTAFSGGVRVAVGDITGDGLPDIVTGAGPGGGPHVKVFDNATGQEVVSFFAYGAAFAGGLFVATGDVNNDGRPDIITGADAGGGPHVKVFSGIDGSVLLQFFAYGANYRGGVRVAAGDIDNDGFADIITAPGSGAGPHVKVFSGQNGSLIREFFAYDGTFSGGVYVAAADVNNNAQIDILTGPGNGGGPHLKIFDGATGFLINQGFAFPPGNVGGGGIFVSPNLWNFGLRVAATDVNLDGQMDVIVAPGAGQTPRIRIIDAGTFADYLPPDKQMVFGPSFLGGIFVAGN